MDGRPDSQDTPVLPAAGAPGGLRPSDLLLLGGVALAVFAVSLVGGRPLTMHEAVLPQSAREMLASGDWLVPTCGGRPWLERPPLPQWITLAALAAFGEPSRFWSVRIAPALCGAAVVLITGWMAGRWFGRRVGMLAGLALSTMLGLVSYAWLAEADIFLCVLVTGAVALFVRQEFSAGSGQAAPAPRPASGRHWTVWALFAALGAANLAKGLAFGTVLAAVPMAGFLLLTFQRRRALRYSWVWGWLVLAAVGAAWPAAVALRHPDVIDLWRYDLLGRLGGSYAAISQPAWYYLIQLPGALLPWTPAALVGLGLAARALPACRSGPHAFVLCWAVLPVAVLSAASGKHHHYLLHCLAPWAVLAGLGTDWLGRRLASLPGRWRNGWLWGAGLTLAGEAALWLAAAHAPGPAWPLTVARIGWPVPAAVIGWAIHARRGAPALAAATVMLLGGYSWGHAVYAPITDGVLDDTAFLRAIPSARLPGVPQAALVSIRDDGMAMDAFRVLFYLDGPLIPLHNLSYLAADDITADRLYVLARQRHQAELARYGDIRPILRSARTRREESPDDRLALFLLTFRPDLRRHPRPPRISPMQAIGRGEGPFVGPAPVP